ncbi:MULTISPECIES: hypothetical protein [Synechococcales]|uniref:hypothetical protein n=1 Tax=Synechococcus sp. CS-1325 TaxID=2847979 RepID=UPI00223B958F|nr:hypothetical protein [Synechococcus sp. CS-1325]
MAKAKLQELQRLIQHSAEATQLSVDNTDADDSLAPSWLIKDATDRTCLLSSYLHPSDYPELAQPATPAAVAEPDATPPT